MSKRLSLILYLLVGSLTLSAQTAYDSLLQQTIEDSLSNTSAQNAWSTDSIYHEDSESEQYPFYDSLSLTQQQADTEAVQWQDYDAEKYKKATEGKSYIEDAQEKPKERTGLKLNWMEGFLRLLFWFILILLFAFLIYLIFRFFSGAWKERNSNIQNLSSEFQWEDLEEQLLESDLDIYLKEALAKEDYRQAVRIYFLMAIRKMHETGCIQWHKHKTNRDYQTECAQRSFAADFSTAIWIYEAVWYGKQEVSEAHFKSLSPSFLLFIQNIHP